MKIINRNAGYLWVVAAIAAVGAASAFGSTTESALANPDRYERFIAVDDACGWPLLIQQKSGEILMLLWPKPNHGVTEGAAEAWASVDEGRHWKKVGVPVPNQPLENRLNVAGGLTADGATIALVGGATHAFPAGWARKPSDPHQPTFSKDLRLLAPIPAISRDGGKTWQCYAAIPDSPSSNGQGYVAYGPIAPLSDKTLGVMLYDYTESNGECSFFVSKDEGATWVKRGELSTGQRHNEVAWIRLSNGDLFAAARIGTGYTGITGPDQHLDGFRSSDEGRTWRFERELSLGGQHPASLTALPDGRILLTYGIRNEGRHAIEARIGDSSARGWSPPITVVDMEGATDLRWLHFAGSTQRPPRDAGYPSTIALSDGMLLTAYYCRGIPEHSRYHVGVVIWALPRSTLKSN